MNTFLAQAVEFVARQGGGYTGPTKTTTTKVGKVTVVLTLPAKPNSVSGPPKQKTRVLQEKFCPTSGSPSAPDYNARARNDVLAQTNLTDKCAQAHGEMRRDASGCWSCWG